MDMNSQVKVIEMYKNEEKEKYVVKIFGRCRYKRSVHHNRTPNNVRQQKQ